VKIKPALINTAVTLATFAIMLFIAEGIIRWTMPQVIQPRFMTDSGFGNRVPAPNKTYHHSVPGDYAITIHTNDFGGRGEKNFPEAKRPGVSRVCILGDSFAFGYGVSDDEVVSAVLESQLILAENSNDYEVLNFGVSGYGQAEQLNLFLNRVQNYDCDDVIVFYYSNDPGNNVVSSLYALDGNGSVVRDQSEYLPGVTIQQSLYGAPILGNLIAHSHLWSIVRNQASALLHQRMLKQKGLSSYSTSTEDTGPIDLTVGLLRTLNSVVQRIGSRFFVFVIPNASLDTNYPFEQLTDFEKNTIDGREMMTGADYHNRDGHWTAEGHRKAADAITEKYKSDWRR